MANEDLALRIRQFLRNLFGSRLVSSLELRVLEVQQECERRIADKDDLIASLRLDLSNLRAKMDTYETVLLPLTSPAGNLFKPKPQQTFQELSGPQPGSWQWVQAEWDRKMLEEAEQEAPKEN